MKSKSIPQKNRAKNLILVICQTCHPIYMRPEQNLSSKKGGKTGIPMSCYESLFLAFVFFLIFSCWATQKNTESVLRRTLCHLDFLSNDFVWASVFLGSLLFFSSLLFFTSLLTTCQNKRTHNTRKADFSLKTYRH